jgi:hypothetical protein
MPKRVLDLLAGWKGGFGKHRNADLWGSGKHRNADLWANPLCIMWTIWREHNQHSFEGTERSPLELKLFLFCAMYDWMAALSGHFFSNLKEFLDLCNFR